MNSCLNSCRRIKVAALAMACSIVGCASFTAVQYYFPEAGEVRSNSAVAVVRTGGPTNFVVIADTPSRISVMQTDGATRAYKRDLPYAIRSLAPGPGRTVWALRSDGASVGRIALDANGNPTIGASFPVRTAHDIAAGGLPGDVSVYVVDDTALHRYDGETGQYLASMTLWVPNQVSVTGEPRVAFDVERNRVVVARYLTMVYPGVDRPFTKLYQRSWSVDLTQVTDQPTDAPLANLLDFEVADGSFVIEKQNGIGSRLEYWDGAAPYASLPVEHASMLQSGTLSSEGALASMAACNGKRGGYLWRARTNWAYQMLERHTICED